MTAGRGYRIADLLRTERPRERLAAHGPQALRDAELLAILLRSGIPGMSALQLADSLLSESNGLAGLQQMPYETLCRRRGLGPAKAAQLLSAVEIGRRLAETMPGGPQAAIQSPEDVYQLVKYEMQSLPQEHLRVLLLDTRNRLIRECEVYVGSLNTSLVRIGEVFREAIQRGAASMIVVHNHPSGDPTPSPEDVAVTRALSQAGELLDIEVLDHVVIGRGGYTSLKAKGLGFG
ncbi:MAG TPA: DNA repair protein RadC [Anaerolineales bacterium]|nr:DNA repair protein RadC [Anaerolineales bacterium]